MSPQIFLDRLSKIITQLDFDTAEQFYEGNEFVCFVSDDDINTYAFQISMTDSGDCKKISFASEKIGDDTFKECVKSIITVYAPDDDAETIISSLYSTNKQKFQYYETQWHSYSFSAEKECRYFSVSSKKLASENNVQLSLKPNDKIDF